jgi:spermidine synthase
MEADEVTYSLNKKVAIRLKGKIIEKRRSKYQDITILDSEHLGRILLLGEGDYAITQFSTKDEQCYHEAIVHPTMALHPNPKRVLVIGGGDGGTIREVLKHPVERVVLAELDDEVIKISKEFFPSLSDGAFEDPRLEVILGDGRKYLEETDEKFDVTVLDLTDSEGPAKMLFTKEFYEAVKSKLTEGGVMSVQTGSPIYEPEQNGRVHATLKQVFKNVLPYGNFVQAFFILTSYVIATDSPVGGISKRLKERGVKLNKYTPEQLEFMTLNPHPFVRDNVAKEWQISTDADPVDIGDLR